MVFFVFCLFYDQMSGGRRPCLVEELSSEADTLQLGQFSGDEKVLFSFYQCTPDCGLLCGNIRLAKAECVEVELPSCNKIGCEFHPLKEQR